jgi:ATP-binding cassette subfamily B multidrug efflux pump
LKSLLQYMNDYKKESVLGPLFKLLEASFELLVPLVMSAIIDTGIAGKDTGYILRMSGVLVALGFVGLACSITAQYFAARAAVGFATKLRHALFGHIQSLSYTEMDTLGASTLITRMTSDINQVQNGLNLTLRLLLRSPFVVFGAMVMAFTIDVKAALVFAVVIPVLCLVVFGIMLISMPLYKKVQKGLDRVLGTTRENLTGVRVIRAFTREADEKDRFDKENQALTHMQMTVGRISALMNPVTYVIINIGLLAVLRRGSIAVNAGDLTQGQVVALVNYMSQILTELIKMANLIITITKALACAGRIESVMKEESSLKESVQSALTEPEQKEIKETPGAGVCFDHVCLTYKSAGAESLTDVSFRAAPGETIGVIGGTGSGKSTLVNLIPRFYDATGGRVTVAGKDVREYSLKELRRMVGVVPQKAQLFLGTIRSNLLWGDEDATDEELWQALTVAQAREFVEKKEGRLEGAVAQGGRNFSGGQRQRLTIARALVRKPRVLILDDSASALDFATDAALRKAIREMPDAPTVFIVSQRASSIRHADQIIVLDDGHVAGIGCHEELLENCPVYREIYESQFEKAEEKGGEPA